MPGGKKIKTEVVSTPVKLSQISAWYTVVNEVQTALRLPNAKHYAYSVPFVENKDVCFLKTIYPSRKYTKQYIEKGA